MSIFLQTKHINSIAMLSHHIKNQTPDSAAILLSTKY